ncbi:MAG: hypothetical protein R6V33_06285 [Pelovirga sp.]
MTKYQFPGLEDHQREHRNLVAEVQKLRKEYVGPDENVAREL